MKVHRVLAEPLFGLLEFVFGGRRVLEHELAGLVSRNPKWGKRDRAFLAGTAYEVVRWRRALGFVAGADDVRSMCVAHWLTVGLEIPDWLGWSRDRVEEAEARRKALPDQARAVRESVPDWLDRLGEEELGDRWPAELNALNQRAPVFLRVNLLKNDVDEAKAWLAGHGIDTAEVPGMQGALELPAGVLLPKALLTEGRVEIQDAGSQLIAPWLDPQPGETVIDACAGAGGKALQMAALMKNRGRLIAMDIDGRKLGILRERAARAGATMVETCAVEDGMEELPVGGADRVLVDAPCSGLGTLRRQPDLKWRLVPESILRIRVTQRRILSAAAKSVKPGGRLVYATCSILPSENRGVAEEVAASIGFRIAGEHRVSPAATGWDGFGAVVLERDA